MLLWSEVVNKLKSIMRINFIFLLWNEALYCKFQNEKTWSLIKCVVDFIHNNTLFCSQISHLLVALLVVTLEVHYSKNFLQHISNLFFFVLCACYIYAYLFQSKYYQKWIVLRTVPLPYVTHAWEQFYFWI